jgi:DNA-binding CsgD family transcriptional regulator
VGIQDVPEPATEHDEIVALIETETAAFLERNIDRLCDCWVREAYVRHTTILPYAGVVQVNGIDGLRNHIQCHFDNEQPLAIDAGSIIRENWQFVVRENMAWVTFEQLGQSDAAAHMSGTQLHTRILEKVDGHWKLVSSTGVLSRLDFYDCPKVHVDGTGKVLEASADSLEVVARHPVLKITKGRVSAVSRKETSRIKDEIQRAQKNIDGGNARLPVPLIFGEDSGSDTSLCWVAILDMKIVVLLNDTRLIDGAIKTAGELYGLSDMQMRVAEEIARGNELTAIATNLDVSINTVRTHIRRMFERVGVNNQKALLKQLLSSQAPTIGLHY